jgi:VWFA-related protein
VKRAALWTLTLLMLAALPASASMQEAPGLRLELSGVNALELPYVEITVNVYNALGQPVGGLTEENFVLSGPLAEYATDLRVESVASSELPFASVLVIDASDSMTGVPLQRAKEAARIFVETVRDIDPVAVLAFGSTIELVQDFTTDKAALLAAIDSIGGLGRTALYQAAAEGVALASDAPVSRRALILLSDGAEYGGLSTATAADAIQSAFLNGVPSYTIGLGYGAERSFLEGLSSATEARFYESPTAEELDEIYTALAQRLSSQYILSMQVNVPLDGREYDFELVAQREDVVSAPVDGSVRAPIPVPVVNLADSLPTDPIAERTEIPITIGADQALDRVMAAIDGGEAQALAGPPYTIIIDPLDYPPGPLTLEVSATDVDGDSGSASGTVVIAALPPLISLSRDLSEMGAINEPIEITVNPFGQTPATDVQLSLNGAPFVTLEPPYTFLIDPLQLPPGDNRLEVVVTNEAGLESTYPADFIIADVPPVVSIVGLADGQTIDAPLSFSLSGVSQTPIIEVGASINGVALADENGVFVLDPMTVPPGPAELTVTATTDRGQTGEASITVEIAALTPIVTLDGLSDGDTVSGDVPVTINVQAQTPGTHAMVMLNGVDVAHPVTFPATIVLPFSAMQPGDNDLSISVDTAAGTRGSLALTFTAPPVLFTPTPTPTITPNVPATGTASAFAASTRTAVAQDAINAASTQAAASAGTATQAAETQTAATLAAVTQAAATEAGATQAAATQAAATEAQATQAQATQAAATQAHVTQSAMTRAAVELASTVTAEALAGQTQAAATRQAATAVAQAATPSPTASAAPPTSIPATATLAPATATAAPASATPVPASPTRSPQPTVDLEGTLSAAAAFVQQAATHARSTVQAQATQTQSARQNATEAAATQSAQATAAAADAQSTAQAATRQAANATRTAQARATSQANTNQTATRLAQELSTATAQAQRTATLQAEATSAFNAGVTQTADAAQGLTAEAVTQAAGTASALEAGGTATADAGRIAATEGAQATRTARAVLAAQTATAAVTREATQTAPPTTEPTHTPQPTLTPVEAQASAADNATSGLWVVFIIIILLAIAIVLWVTRMSKRRFDR